MGEWNAALYAEFLSERSMPAWDLLAKCNLKSPHVILDLGSGPGNSTALIKEKYKDALVIGGDNSKSMLSYARSLYPEITFQEFDAESDFDKYYCHFDMVFSNACIQWVKNHEKLMDDMMRSIKPEGILAVQVPYNFREPVNTILDFMLEEEKWKNKLSKRPFYLLREEEYYAILMKYSKRVSIWKTTYYHVLKNHEAILEWYRSTGLKPYLEQLTEEEKQEFCSEYLEKIKESYPLNTDGTVLFPFPRLFFVAEKKDKVLKNKFIPKADLDMMELDHYEHHMGG